MYLDNESNSRMKHLNPPSDRRYSLQYDNLFHIYSKDTRMLIGWEFLHRIELDGAFLDGGVLCT